MFKFSSQAGMQPLQDQRQTPALVKSSFTEAFLAVLRCTDAINPFEEVRGKERLHCFAQPVLTCQHAIKRFKHDMCNCCPALPFFNVGSYLLA